jgi:hypothetical protein
MGSRNDTVVSGGGTVYTSTIGFSTTTPYLDNSASYDGPAQYGGAFRQSIFAEAQTDNPGDWFTLRPDLGIYSRRNGPSGASSDTGIVRIGTLFDLGGASCGIDSTSTFSMLFTGAAVTDDNSSTTLFVENSGALYLAVMDVAPSSSSQTFSGLDTLDFQQVTVDATTLELTTLGGTVPASTLTNITKVGFFMDLLTTSTQAPGHPSPSIKSFSADLTVVPEPVSLLLIGPALGTLALRRRQRSLRKA